MRSDSRSDSARTRFNINPCTKWTGTKCVRTHVRTPFGLVRTRFNINPCIKRTSTNAWLLFV